MSVETKMLGQQAAVLRAVHELYSATGRPVARAALEERLGQGSRLAWCLARLVAKGAIHESPDGKDTWVPGRRDASPAPEALLKEALVFGVGVARVGHREGGETSVGVVEQEEWRARASRVEEESANLMGAVRSALAQLQVAIRFRDDWRQVGECVEQAARVLDGAARGDVSRLFLSLSQKVESAELLAAAVRAFRDGATVQGHAVMTQALADYERGEAPRARTSNGLARQGFSASEVEAAIQTAWPKGGVYDRGDRVLLTERVRRALEDGQNGAAAGETSVEPRCCVCGLGEEVHNLGDAHLPSSHRFQAARVLPAHDWERSRCRACGMRWVQGAARHPHEPGLALYSLDGCQWSPEERPCPGPSKRT